MLHQSTPGALGLSLLLVSMIAGVTEATLPNRVEMERVKALAFQLEMDTDEAYVEALRAATSAIAAEEEALRRLYTLQESASYFHDQVQASFDDPAHTRVAFERLNADFIESREEWPKLTCQATHRELLETIVDTMGNLRAYYVTADAAREYADYEVYPYYPGYRLFVHVYAPAKPYHFRHDVYWHLHPSYAKRFPHRVHYRYGYGRYDVHYSHHVKRVWHKKVVGPKHPPKHAPKHAPKPSQKHPPKKKP